MSSKALGMLLKAAVVIIGIGGLFACGIIFLFFIIFVALANVGEYYAMVLLMLLCAFVLPCYVILFFVWKIAKAVEEEQVFTFKTADLIKFCTQLLFSNIIVYFIGNAIFALINYNIFFMFIAFPFPLVIIVLGLIAALFAAVLSRYVTKAAALQEQTEGTI